MKPRVLVLRTAGTNCDKESAWAFTHAGALVEVRHINAVKQTKDIARYQIVCFPGGFSYGDDLGAGKIFSLELLLWLKDSLRECIDKGGLMLGICNGFQIMVKTGILPFADFKQAVTLENNDSGRFEDRWVYLKTETSNQSAEAGKAKTEIPHTQREVIWTKGLPEVIAIPVAHGEGKFVAPASVLRRIERDGHVVFRYCDREGAPGKYPCNPNGAQHHIAGITDETGRILGLMPHPERAMFEHQLPGWQTTAERAWGAQLFENAVNYFK